MEPKEAAAIFSRAISSTTDRDALRSLSLCLSSVAARMEPKEAAQAAEALTRAIGSTTDPFALHSLSLCLSSVAARMEPKEAAQAYSRAAAALTQAISRTMYQQSVLSLSQDLADLLLGVDPFELSTRDASVASAVAILAHPQQWRAACAILLPALEPLSCRLTTQQLVDLLKLHTCPGEARRVVLDQLENRYGRRFADHWEFVQYAQDQKLDLDFTSPPPLELVQAK
jgi:hypothetical protein